MPKHYLMKRRSIQLIITVTLVSVLHVGCKEKTNKNTAKNPIERMNVYSAFKTFTGSTFPARMVWDRTVRSPSMATIPKPMLRFIRPKSS